nr:ryanodine receptor 2-like [Loxodonta africana]
MDKEKADVKSTAFTFRSSKEKLDVGIRKEVDGMGTSEIKYGDSVCYIQHVDTGLWLTYQSVDVKSVRMGSIQRKVRLYEAQLIAVILHELNAQMQDERGS